MKKLWFITLKNSNRGFSLIETIVCLSLLVILTVTLLTTLAFAFGTVKITRIQNEMNYTLQSIIENIKAGNIQNYLDDENIANLNNEGTADFTIDNYQCSIKTTKENFENLYIVNLDIKYQDGRVNISQNLSTLLLTENFQ